MGGGGSEGVVCGGDPPPLETLSCWGVQGAEQIFDSSKAWRKICPITYGGGGWGWGVGLRGGGGGVGGVRTPPPEMLSC